MNIIISCMKKFIFIFCLTFFSSYVFSAEGGIDFIYGGESFLAGDISIGVKNFGVDLYYISQKIGEVTQQSYALTPYYEIGQLLRKEKYHLNWLVGFGLSQAFYDGTSSDISFSLNTGLVGRYNLSGKKFIDAKGIMFIYSDGFSIPWDIGFNYPTSQKLTLRFGAGGLSNLVIDKEINFFNKFGIFAGIKYAF